MNLQVNWIIYHKHRKIGTRRVHVSERKNGRPLSSFWWNSAQMKLMIHLDKDKRILVGFRTNTNVDCAILTALHEQFVSWRRTNLDSWKNGPSINLSTSILKPSVCIQIVLYLPVNVFMIICLQWLNVDFRRLGSFSWQSFLSLSFVTDLFSHPIIQRIKYRQHSERSPQNPSISIDFKLMNAWRTCRQH